MKNFLPNLTHFFSTISPWVQPDEVDKASEVSTCTTDSFKSQFLHMNSATVRKRLTARSLSVSPARTIANKYALSAEGCHFKQLETIADPKSKTGCKSKIYPKNLSFDGYRSSVSSSFDRRSTSRESSDLEFDPVSSQEHSKKSEYKNEEKSQLICYKDNAKIVTIKNDSRLTKYNTFDIKVNERRGQILKYKSLDEADSKTLVKYLEPQSKISISSQDFGSDFKFTKLDRKKNKHDIITDTVDAWAKKSSKNVFSNIRNSIFKSSAPEKEVVFKPLIFGGTFPIDMPELKTEKRISKSDKGSGKLSSKPSVGVASVVREYGPPKTFSIDQPI